MKNDHYSLVANQPVRNLFCRIFLPAIFMLMIPTASIFADGAYFQEQAHKKLPAIPTQRALLVYEDQTEQLVIESALDAEGQRFGWIVPVPAQPTQIEKTSPGLLRTLSLNMEPEIVHDRGEVLHPLLGIPVVIVIWLLFVLHKPSSDRFLVTVRLLTLLLFYGFFCLFFFMPNLSKSRGFPRGAVMTAGVEYTAGVQVIESSVIGNYEVTVLTAQTADALNTWLTNNGFTPLPDRGRKIAEDYIRDKWVFVAAKLQRDGSGLSTPHPLAMTFPTASPVYPMKLTSLVEEPVYLELFVVSDQQAQTRRLDLEMTDRFWFQKNWGGKGDCFLGGTFYIPIGLPNASDFLWDGCTISKLTGTLKPGHMKKDFYITLSESTPGRRTLYSSRGACETGLLWSIGLWSVILPLGFIVVYNHEVAFCNLKRVFAPITLSAVVLGISIFFCLPRTEVTTSFGQYKGKKFFSWVQPKSYYTALYELKEKLNSKTLSADSQTIEAFLEDYFTENAVPNPFTGERIRRDISPGNYTIETVNDGLLFKTYDRHGFPIRYGLSE